MGRDLHRLIAEVDKRYGVFLGETFKLDRFQALVDRLRLAWPRTPTGRLATDEDTFKTWRAGIPSCASCTSCGSRWDRCAIRLPVGPDGRNRCLLSPFGTITGRNAPSSTESYLVPRHGGGA